MAVRYRIPIIYGIDFFVAISPALVAIIRVQRVATKRAGGVLIMLRCEFGRRPRTAHAQIHRQTWPTTIDSSRYAVVYSTSITITITKMSCLARCASVATNFSRPHLRGHNYVINKQRCSDNRRNNFFSAIESSTYEITCRLVQQTLPAFASLTSHLINDYLLLWAYCKLNFT